MSRSEKSILNDALVGVTAEPETIAWRNNTGTAWAGKRLNLTPGQIITISDPNGIREPRRYRATQATTIMLESQPVSFGLVGSGDILGASAGRPFSIETKTSKGRQSTEQQRFEVAWRRAGGIYILGRDPDEIVRDLRASLQVTEMQTKCDIPDLLADL